MKNIFLVVLLLDVVPSFYAMDASEEKGAPRAQLPKVSRAQKVIDVLGGSRLVSWFTQRCASRKPIPQARVSPELERMWNDAQIHVGILPQFRVPIRYQEGKSSAAFSMHYGFLCVESKGYMKYSPAYLRQRLLHEARHHLFNDSFMLSNFSAGASLASYFVGAVPLIRCNNENWLHFMVNAGVALGVGFFLHNYVAVQKKCERRADIQAAYDLGCKKCIRECAVVMAKYVARARKIICQIDQFGVIGRKNYEESRRNAQRILEDYGGGNSPYLSGAEFAAIAEKVSAVCEDHLQESMQSRALTFQQIEKDMPYVGNDFLSESGQSRMLTFGRSN